MHTALLGTDFNKASLDILEKLYFDDTKIKSFTAKIPQDAPIQELVILATCNRTEIYFTCASFMDAIEWMKGYISEFFGIPRAQLESIYYESHCLETIKHLFQVSSGIKSMVIGENEILGQVKYAYQFCQAIDATGSHLNKLFNSAIATGKRVRDQTEISRGGYSISSIAIETMKFKTENIQSKKVLIIGAGTMCIRAIKKLQSMGVQNLSLTNRSPEKGTILAHEFGIEFIPFDNLYEVLSQFDVLYFATGSKIHLLKPVHLQNVSKEMVVIDVGVPRNVDSEIQNMTNMTLITIDNLREVADSTLRNRLSQVEKVNRIIDEEIDNFVQWYEFKHNSVEQDICLESAT